MSEVDFHDYVDLIDYKISAIRQYREEREERLTSEDEEVIRGLEAHKSWIINNVCPEDGCESYVYLC